MLLPNQFELSLLTGSSVRPYGGSRAARGSRRYPALQIVIVKGIRVPGIPSHGGLPCAGTRTQHPVLAYRVSGTGDAFSAAWLALYLRTQSLHLSLTYAGEFLYRVVQRTAQQRQRELQLLPELPWLQQTLRRLEQEPT